MVNLTKAVERRQKMSAEEIVERIMTQHWDMAACTCWICRHGRAEGLRPRVHYRDIEREFARVRMVTEKKW